MAKNAKNAPEVVATEVVANEVVNTSNRPRPEVIVYSEEVHFQSLDGTKWATLPYTMDGKTRVIDCQSITDPSQLKGFKVGPYRFDIPQYNVAIEFTATYNEVAEDGQRFKGSKTFFKALATFADGTTKEFDTTGDEIRKGCGIAVEGVTKSPLGVAYRHFSKSEVKGYVEACNNAEVTKAYDQLRGLLGKLYEAEREAEAEAKAKAQERAKQANKDALLIKSVASRLGISIAEASAMLGI